MNFLRSIQRFFSALIRGGAPKSTAGSATPKSGGLDMEVEKNRHC